MFPPSNRSGTAGSPDIPPPGRLSPSMKFVGSCSLQNGSHPKKLRRMGQTTTYIPDQPTEPPSPIFVAPVSSTVPLTGKKRRRGRKNVGKGGDRKPSERQYSTSEISAFHDKFEVLRGLLYGHGHRLDTIFAFQNDGPGAFRSPVDSTTIQIPPPLAGHAHLSFGRHNPEPVALVWEFSSIQECVFHHFQEECILLPYARREKKARGKNRAVRLDPDGRPSVSSVSTCWTQIAFFPSRPVILRRKTDLLVRCSVLVRQLYEARSRVWYDFDSRKQVVFGIGVHRGKNPTRRAKIEIDLQPFGSGLSFVKIPFFLIDCFPWGKSAYRGLLRVVILDSEGVLQAMEVAFVWKKYNGTARESGGDKAAGQVYFRHFVDLEVQFVRVEELPLLDVEGFLDGTSSRTNLLAADHVVPTPISTLPLPPLPLPHENDFPPPPPPPPRVIQPPRATCRVPLLPPLAPISLPTYEEEEAPLFHPMSYGLPPPPPVPESDVPKEPSSQDRYGDPIDLSPPPPPPPRGCSLLHVPEESSSLDWNRQFPAPMFDEMDSLGIDASMDGGGLADICCFDTLESFGESGAFATELDDLDAPLWDDADF